ncbi:hypothetical protein ACL6C3_14380 [Capilliphycus salinus ALCB114379]|uniref:hypothetical protein n=1 Tax=Capilliphycus salinus TaxID=2768948 RepID=UPI0039A5FADE
MNEIVLTYHRIITWSDANHQSFDPMEDCLPDWYENTWTVAEQMITSGQTYWEHRQFWEDLEMIFSSWLQRGYLIKAQLIAQWLLSNFPEKILSPKTKPILELISQEKCIEALNLLPGHRHPYSRWPRRAEYYFKTLHWNLARIALESEESEYLWAASRIKAKQLGVNSEV